MALVKHLKVHVVQHPSIGLLLEHKNNKDILLVEQDFSVILNSEDGNQLKSNSSKVADAYGCLGAVNLSRGAESMGYFLLLITGCRTVGRILDSDIYRVTDVSFVSIKSGSIDSSSASSEMKRLLCTGSFYFVALSADDSNKTIINITQSLQHKSVEEDRSQYLWNRSLLAYFSFRGIPIKSWFIHVMCGGVDIRTIYVGAYQARAAVVNRLSCERVGTRYNVRGVDDKGNVANFVESEQIVCIGDNYSSFIQIRGSVPLYWEQPGLNVGSHKVKIPFEFNVSFEAFERHLENISKDYLNCAIVNLLGSKEGEAFLSRTFQHHHESSKFANDIPMTSFDYHTECRAGKSTNISKLMDQLNPLLDKYGLFSVVEGNRSEQSGVLRLNCLDCLDRTNSVQSYVGMQIVSKQLEVLGYSDNSQLLGRFTEALKGVWQQTGDLISRMYAGTGALEGKDKVGKLKDGARSISRSIQNNFLDQGKQETMDTFLRIPFHEYELHHVSRVLLDQQQFRKSSSHLLREVYARRAQFCEDLLLRICVGTWNVNGGKLFRSIAYKDKTLKDWLIFDESPNTSKKYYQALYDYASAEDGDLSLCLNDIVVVDDDLEDGEWLHGFKGEEEGIFPAAYVQHLANPHIVLHDFPAQEDGDLQLNANEVVDVIEVNGEWMTGRVVRNGETEEGIFPSNFVDKLDGDSDPSTPVDLYAIGFEEMVELNAGNIVNASQANQQAWATELQKTLSAKQEYVLITSEQLVGVCLFLYVRKHLVANIREVSVSTIKTGMGGATGNKGAVAISCVVFNTSMCFVCSHFAAGQTQIQERNNDFDEISNKLTFSKGRNLFCHDYVFWCGDFNYRIDMTGDEVKQLVKSASWDKLKENDQLRVQKKMGNVFKGFHEGETDFAPTYKYDLFSDDYDTSEKCRVPAWTDRILWKRRKWFGDSARNGEADQDEPFNSGSLVLYKRAELKTSDHRPVVAVIDIVVTEANESRRTEVYNELANSLQPIDTPVYMYVEGKPGDEALCRRFLGTLNFGDKFFTKCFPDSCLIVCAEAWMAPELLQQDGSIFEGKRVRLSLTNDNVVEAAAEVKTLSHVTSEPVITGHNNEDKEISALQQPSMPISHSSGNIAGLHVPPIPRPRSTPPVVDQVGKNEPIQPKSQTPKRAPPRPPAISSRPPPRPPSLPASNKQQLNPVPEPTSRATTVSSLMAPLQPVPVEDTQPAPVASTEYSFPDLSLWDFPSEPPKIKPRKTVPKRRAPVPPKQPPQNRKNSQASSPLVPLPVNQQPSPKSNSLLDDVILFETTPSIPPLVPSQPFPNMYSSSIMSPLVPEQINTHPPKTALPSPIVPLQSTNASLPPPLLPSQPFNGKTTSQDPWSGVNVNNGSAQINKSFTTDFSDFKFS